jgi:hypothetical protein
MSCPFLNTAANKNGGGDGGVHVISWTVEGELLAELAKMWYRFAAAKIAKNRIRFNTKAQRLDFIQLGLRQINGSP